MLSRIDDMSEKKISFSRCEQIFLDNLPKMMVSILAGQKI